MKAHVLLAALVLTTTSFLGGCDYEEEETIQNDSSEQVASENQLERHCTIAASVQRQGQPVATEVAEPLCYESFAEAIAAATKGAVRLPSDATPAALDKLDATQVATLGTYIIAIEYVAPRWDSFWGSKIVTASGTCDLGYTIWIGNLVSWGMNDNISSVRTFEGCAHAYHYEHANFGGAVLDCPPASQTNGHDTCYYGVGAMNDHTSSIFWTN